MAESAPATVPAVSLPPPAAAPAPAPAPVDGAAWRALVTDADALKEAERTPDLNTAFKRIRDLTASNSKAIIIPGKDAPAERIQAYRKAMDIPDDAKGYEFTRPEHMPEETFKSPQVQNALGGFAKAMHDAGVSRAGAKAAWDFYTQAEAAAEKAQVEADKAFAATTADALRKDWPGAEYDKNSAFANRAFAVVAGKAGLSLDALRGIELKSGRYLMDDPNMLRLWAALGREMNEGSLGPAITDADRLGINDEIKAVRGKIDEAQAKGDSAEANRLYAIEQDLIKKRDGSSAIVGAAGRTV